MKNQNITLSPASPEILEARYGLRVAARLSERADDLPRDIAERLRASREQALARARVVAEAQAVPADSAAPVGQSVLALLGGWSDRWFRFAALAPALALVAGLLLIERVHEQSQIAAAAEIDAALLADDVPPTAYSDPGFVEFLKAEQAD